jgi:hypothetical protein
MLLIDSSNTAHKASQKLQAQKIGGLGSHNPELQHKPCLCFHVTSDSRQPESIA